MYASNTTARGITFSKAIQKDSRRFPLTRPCLKHPKTRVSLSEI
jgi:hypothetical protein